MAWTVLIVDDHPGFRGFARRLLEADGFTVVGEAGDGTSALAAVDALEPELVLLDIVLPDTDGFAVADRLAQRADAPAVVLTSSREAADFGCRLEQTAAHGFIHKDDLSGYALVALVGELGDRL
jgi:DNA-binding NarL/FixJ family response regulator